MCASRAPGVQLLDDTPHQHFRSRCTRGDADMLHAVEPALLHVLGTIDQVRRGGHAFSQFAQAVGVGAVRAAYHQHHIALVGQLLDGVLTVLRGVADVVFARPANRRETLAQGIDNAAGVVHRQRGLGHERQRVRVAHLQRRHVVFILDQIDRAAIGGVVLAHGAFDFRVTGVADQDALATITAVASDLDMHFGDQRAGGIEDFQATTGSLGAHGLGNAVGTENNDDVVRHLVQLFDEDRAARAQVFDDKFVVYHFMSHVDRRTKHFQSAIDDFDRAVHTGTKAAGVGEFDLHAVPHVWSSPTEAGLDGGDQEARIAFTSKISTSKLRVLPASGWLKSMVTCSSSNAFTTPGNSVLAASLKITSNPSDSSMPTNCERGMICTFCGLG
ncbi:Uncharacterized protein ALO83_04863 [Pseudomonas cannabina pv. alisalensis]|nr:Uncharacterized protein ALO83_04863 [Pseudomonas cannabina pv. alisalensis]